MTVEGIGSATGPLAGGALYDGYHQVHQYLLPILLIAIIGIGIYR
jgi:hypothetical protein